MTEGQEEHATQQLNENKEADEKPAEDSSATADQRREEQSTRGQLASGEPGDGNNPTQEESKQEDESKPEDTSTQEAVTSAGVTESTENGEPVQTSDSDAAVNSEEQMQKESGGEKPTENEGSPDNAEETIAEGCNKPSEIQEVQQREGEETQVPQGDDQKPTEEQQGGDSEEQQGGDSEEQQGGEELQGESQEVQKVENEQEEGGKSNTGQVEQQEILPVPSTEEGEKSTHSEGEKPIGESENQETAETKGEEEKVEDGQINEDGTKDIQSHENSTEVEDHSTQEGSEPVALKNSEATEDGQKVDETDHGEENPDTKPEEDDNAQEIQTVEGTSAESEPITERQEQITGDIDKPVESQQHTQSAQPGVTTVQVVAVPTDEAIPHEPDELQEENKKLKQDIFMMKQQEDAYRIRVLSLEQEVGKLRARKIDNRSQDSLASDSDSYLKQKLAETERELDTAERKVKDLQLRLKRFAKDDQIKDEKIFQMDKEVKELSEHIKKLEQSLAESKRAENNNNAAVQTNTSKNDSKVCVIL